MSNFDPNAILRGAQLTLVGGMLSQFHAIRLLLTNYVANRALQNPRLFTSDHYRQAALAVAAGAVIRLLVAIPVIAVQLIIWIFGLFVDLRSSSWENEVIEGLQFLEHSVLQVPFFLMSLMRHITPALDEMFMESLDWVDRTYVQKHKSDDPHTIRAMYYPNMKLYQRNRRDPNDPDRKKTTEAILAFLANSARKAGLSLAIYFLSYLPYVGRFVLPAASFYTFRNAVGTQPAVVIFATGIFLPRRYLVVFLQSYFSSRSLMRQLVCHVTCPCRFNAVN